MFVEIIKDAYNGQDAGWEGCRRERPADGDRNRYQEKAADDVTMFCNCRHCMMYKYNKNYQRR